uniref:Uncharacterized protein n=1 Tax=Parascaris equorum TaxID=6256 RepID=A0A914RNB3_PAREQ
MASLSFKSTTWGGRICGRIDDDTCGNLLKDFASSIVESSNLLRLSNSCCRFRYIDRLLSIPIHRSAVVNSDTSISFLIPIHRSVVVDSDTSVGFLIPIHRSAVVDFDTSIGFFVEVDRSY